MNINPDLVKSISAEFAWNFKVIPHSVQENLSSFLYVKGGNTFELKNELEFITGKQVELIESEELTINQLLYKYYPIGDKSSQNQELKVSSLNNDFLVKLIKDAKTHGSSDIHIEIYEKAARIRIRVDGKLKEVYSISKTDYPALVNKIKIKANMDISEKRLPQDGRIIFEDETHSFDIRASVLPTLYGEKIVLRLLNKDTTNLKLESLGFTQKQYGDYVSGIYKSNGIVLISGPTGSGKTTTLYATLKVLNKEGINILTIEDPIEYTLSGINQVQLKESIGLTFSSALRTFLRQDPDIIMLGEIRDAETAQMAIRAALTGHLVLSTIHTNSAWGTIGRLIDMGIPPFLITATLNLSVAQRLVRLLCPACKHLVPFSTEDYSLLNLDFQNPEHHYVAKGCEKCYYTGYSGRKAIYEVIPIDQELHDSVKHNNLNISSILEKKEISLLSKQAWDLFTSGCTTFEEIAPILLSN